MNEVVVPKEAIERAANRLPTLVLRAQVRHALEAAAPLILAANRDREIAEACQAMLDEAFPDGEDSDHHYGCERLLDVVNVLAARAVVLRGDQT